MNFQLFTDYPAWFWLLCIACGLLYAGGMYYKEKKINDSVTNHWWKRFLFSARLIAVTIIAALLINPYLKSSNNETEKPVIVIAQDNSSSILHGMEDSVAYKKLISDLTEKLSDDYEVNTYIFGESLQQGLDGFNFSDRSTDLSTALSQINNLYENLNVGAIVFATDGIYNTGSNPVYVKNEIGAPVYSIALGDTIQKKDIRITRALHNNIVYLKDRFNIITEIEAIFCTGSSPRISLSEISKGSNKLLGEKNITITTDQENTSVSWELSADAPGIRHYQVRIQQLENEMTFDNNVRDVYVEVLDARQKILLLANSPHPDIYALKEAIESNQNYELEIQLAGQMKGNLEDYNLVIMHQLPTSKYPVVNIISTLNEKNIPAWFITGSQTSIQLLNKAQTLVTINSGGQSENEVTASADRTFNLFTADENSISVVPKLPALKSPYGQYITSPASQVLLYQKIGAVATKNPLLIYSLPGGKKTAVLLGENLWKWRLYDYVLNKDHAATNELINKTVQYLAAKNDKKQFRVTQTKNVMNENEAVILDAELYNDSYQLVNEPDATVTIKNEDGKDFPFQFSKTEKSYTLNAGYFPSGNYSYEAKVVYNGKTFSDNGAFSISPVRLETINTTANHKLLNQLSAQTGGSVIYPNESEIGKLVDLIAASANAKPVMREITKTQSIINLKWIFFLLLGLLAMEWFVRKYNGSY